MSFDVSQFLSSGPELTTGERAVSIVVGLMLAASSAKPRPNMFLNLLALLGGSYLAYRGATGYCPIKGALTEHAADRSPRRITAG